MNIINHFSHIVTSRNQSSFCEPSFAFQLGLGGWNVLVGLNRLYLIPQPIFGRKEGLLKFSLCTECFTVQCYNLTANNSRHKIYFPCCVSNLVVVILIWMLQCEAPFNRANDADVRKSWTKTHEFKGWILSNSNFH